MRQYRKPLEELNLTYTQYLVMMVLWEHGSMTEGQLGRIVHLESGTLAPLLKRLDKAGYLNRTRPEDNERKLVLNKLCFCSIRQGCPLPHTWPGSAPYPHTGQRLQLTHPA